MHPISARVWDALTSLKLSIACLSALMVLVVACTLAQVHLGTFGAVEVYMRRWLVWWYLPNSTLALPIFPGGALVGVVLVVNLFAAQLRRMELSWKKAGLWVVHAGLILMIAGEFIAGMYQVDTQLAIEEGQTANYLESPREMELAIVDVSDPAHDDVYGIPESLLARASRIAVPGTPIVLDVKAFHRNAQLAMRTPGDPTPVVATAGVGTNITVHPLAPVSRDDQVNTTTALVEPVAGGEPKGTWLVSAALAAPQRFVHGGRAYEMQLRPRRTYLPYTLHLKDFKHDVYPGTQIPKNFSSLVHLSNPSTGEARDVLVYMNQPLRYDGKAFYQASFGKDDTLSILQVVENPGWLLPYVSCVLVTVGLLFHFGITLRRSARRRAQAQAQAAAVEA